MPAGAAGRDTYSNPYGNRNGGAFYAYFHRNAAGVPHSNRITHTDHYLDSFTNLHPFHAAHANTHPFAHIYKYKYIYTRADIHPNT
jgi:hypothetical protein